MTLDRLLRRPVRSLFAWVMRTLCLLMLGLAYAGMAQAQPIISQLDDTPDPVPAGGYVDYTVGVGSATFTALTNVTVVVVLPANSLYVGVRNAPASVNCTPQTAVNKTVTLTCTGINVAAGQNAKTTLDVRVKALTQPNLKVTAKATDPATGNVSSQDETTAVNQGANLGLVIDAPATVAAGGTGKVKFTVTNAGPDISPSSTLTYNVPPGFTVAVSDVPAGCALMSPVLTCTRTTALAVGASYSFEVTGTVTVGSGSVIAHGATVAAGGSVEDGVPDDNTRTANTAVTAGTTLRLVKGQYQTSGAAITAALPLNQDFTYRFEGFYTGDFPANAVLTDDIPANFCIRGDATFSPANPGWQCTVSTTCDKGGTGGRLQCSRVVDAAHPAGAAGENKSMGQISLPVRTLTQTAGVTNVAYLNAPPALQAQGSVGTSVLGSGVFLRATKSRDASTYKAVVVGQPFRYLIGAVNESGNPVPTAGSTITLTDNVPLGLSITGIWMPAKDRLGSGTASCNANPTDANPLVGPATLKCTLTNVGVAAGASVPNFTLLAKATAVMAKLENEACAYQASSVPNTFPSENCITHTMEVQAQETDVRVVKTVVGAGDAAGNRQLSGETIKWQIEVINDKPGTARNVSVRDLFKSVDYSHYAPPALGLPKEKTSVAKMGSCFLWRASNNAETGGDLGLDCTITELPTCQPGSTCPVIEIPLVHFNPDTAAAPDTFTNINPGANAESLSSYDSNTANNSTGAVTGYLQARADLNVSQTDMPDPVAVGQLLTYTIHVNNPYKSPSNARNVKVTDTLPLGVVLVQPPVVDGSGSCGTYPPIGVPVTAANRTVECTWPLLARTNVEKAIDIKVRPLASLMGQTISNTVTVSSDTTEMNPADNTATITTQVVQPQYDIMVNNTDNADPVASAVDVTYTLTVSNNQASTAENVVLTDTLPSGTGAPTFVGMVTPLPAGVSCDTSKVTVGQAGGTVTCTIATLGGRTTSADHPATGEPSSVAIYMKLRAVGAGTYLNTADVRLRDDAQEKFNERKNPHAVEQSTVYLDTDVLVVEKYAVNHDGTSRITTVSPSQTFDWLVTIRNAGDKDAQAVQFRDALPNGMELAGTASFNATSGAFTLPTPACSGAAGATLLTCDITTMPAKGEATVRIPVRFRTPLPGNNTQVENTATLVTQDSNPANNSGKGSVTVLTTAISGYVFHDVNGNGGREASEPGIVTKLTLQGKDTNNNNVSLSTTSANDGSWSFAVPPGTYTVTETPPEGFLPGVTTPGTIAGTGQAGTVATRTADVISNIRLDAGASSQNNLFGEVKAAGADVQVVRKLPVPKDAPLASTTALASVAVGDSFDWLVKVSNAGDAPAQTVKVSDTLADGMVFVGDAEVSASSGFTLSCAKPVLNTLGATLTCSSDSMPAGATATVRLRVKLLNDPGKAQLENTAAISTTTPETNTTNNTGKGQVPVLGQADVQVLRKLPVPKGAPLASTTALASVAVGDSFDWLVTVSNAGGSAAQTVKVSDTLADGMVFVGDAEVSASGGFTLSCPTPALNTLGATLTCSSDSMPAGATATVRLRVKLLNDPGKTQLENTAAISTTTPETNTANNTGKGQVPVPARAGSVLSGYVYHDVNADGLKAGGESGPGVAAVLTLVNAGTGATVATTTSDPATGFWQFVNLPAGSYTVTLTPLGGDYKPGITQAGTVGGQKSGVVPVTGAGVSSGPKGSTANLIQAIVLPAAGSSVDNLFSVVKLASLGGRVYADVDASKSLSTGDTGLAGVTLTLSGTDFLGNAVKASGTTSAATTGDFGFPGLLPGSYKLVQTQPADYIDGAETAGSAGGSTAVNDEISGITLGSGVGATGYFFGEVKRPNADITLKVFEDPDNDGVPAANDPGIKGVTITLTGKDVLGNPVSVTATAVDSKPGSYVFKDVPPSDATGYTLTETQPGNYLPGKAGVNGFPGTAQANGNLITGVLVNTGATAVSSLGDYHFGERVTERSTLSGRVWRDSNHDRKFDPNEPVMGGWMVQLVACSDGGTGCTSSGFVVKGSATTGADGTYRMTDILPGKYQLRFLNPAGAIVGGVWPTDKTINAPGSVNEPRPGMAWITLTGPNGEASLPEEVTNQDLPLDPSGVVYDSRTANPLPGATVRLSGPNGFSPARDLLAGTDTVLTDATGIYQFFFLPSAPAGSYTLSVTPPADYRNSADFPAQEGALNMVDCTTSKGEVVDANVQPPCLVSSQSLPTLPPPRYFLTLANPGTNAQGQNLGQAVVNNHIPLDPLVLNNTLIVLTKTTPKLTVKKGEPVPYTITARYTGPVALGRVALVDTLPPGFKLLEGSLTVQTLANGPVTPARAVVQGRQLQLQDQSFAVGETKKIQMVLAVGVGVGEGEYVNSVVARRGAVDISNTATAAVRVVPDALLDCTDVIGKVYDDRNANGVQDQGEPGLPNVRIATVNGLLVNTDADGRYHIACVAVPKEGTGSNLVLKVDERTLPSGYRVTTENPASERITRGKAVKVNFGATVHRVVRLALQSAAFADGADTLKAEHEARLAQVIEALDARPSIVRVAYEAAAGEDAALGQARAASVRQALLERWKAHCRAKGQALFNLDVEVERVPASTTPTRR